MAVRQAYGAQEILFFYQTIWLAVALTALVCQSLTQTQIQKQGLFLRARHRPMRLGSA
jgi:hypothetical protein